MSRRKREEEKTAGDYPATFAGVQDGLTPDEQLIASRLNGAQYMDPARRDIDRQTRHQNAEYLRQLGRESATGYPTEYQLSVPRGGPGSRGYVSDTMMMRDEELVGTQDGQGIAMPGSGEGQVGGFLAALAPILAQVGVPILSSLLGNLLGPRGRGMDGGRILNQYLNANFDELPNIEGALMNSSGKKWWRNMHNLVRTVGTQIGQGIGAGDDEIEGAINKVFPKSFVKFLSQVKEKGQHRQKGGIMRPGLGRTLGTLAHYCLWKADGNPERARKIYEWLKTTRAFDDETVEKSGIFTNGAGIYMPGQYGWGQDGGSKKGWNKFVNGLKNFGKKAWDFVKNVFRGALPGIASAIPQMVPAITDGIANKFNMGDTSRQIMSDVLTNAASIPNQVLQGNTARDIGMNMLPVAYDAARQLAPIGVNRVMDKIEEKRHISPAIRDKVMQYTDKAMEKLGQVDIPKPSGKGKKKQPIKLVGEGKKKGGAKGKLTFRITQLV